MVTCNPADALGWGDQLGRLKVGLHGDVLVTTDRGGDAYRNLIESVETDVRFVAINGQPFYGATKLMQAAGAHERRADQGRAAAAVDRARLPGHPRRRHGLGGGAEGARRARPSKPQAGAREPT